MFHREPSLMSDTRNQCLQLVPYLQWGLVHKLVCRAPFDQDKIFLSGTRTNSTDIFYYYTREREQEKKGHKKPWVTSVLYSPFIPLQKLSEGSAYRLASNRSKRNNFFRFIHWRQNSQNNPQYHIVSAQYFSSEKFQSTLQFQQFFKVKRAITNTSPCPLHLLIHNPLNPV